jgi:hypothetical protein
MLQWRPALQTKKPTSFKDGIYLRAIAALCNNLKQAISAYWHADHFTHDQALHLNFFQVVNDRFANSSLKKYKWLNSWRSNLWSCCSPLFIKKIPVPLYLWLLSCHSQYRHPVKFLKMLKLERILVPIGNAHKEYIYNYAK